MQEILYKTFSWKTHKKNWHINKPNVCQFELTFRCGLHCRHCYTDCYNKLEFLKNELNTKEVKVILDKAYNSGVVWLCLTGGDPLTRKDFLEIYSYAKKKGFLVTVFTNGFSMTEEIAQYLKKEPPFVVEMTLSAVEKNHYERISQVKGSFEKVMQGIELMLKNKIPLKIKTQVTKDNFDEIQKIKKFIKSFGLEFRPSFDIYARLDGDTTPCDLRISSEQVLKLMNKKESFEDDCKPANRKPQTLPADRQGANQMSSPALFRCAIGGGDGFNVDPFGNTFSCNLIREPKFNLLKVDIEYARNKLLPLVRNRKFTTDSKCVNCNLIDSCRRCPGRVFLETGDMEAPVEYYCQLAKALANGH